MGFCTRIESVDSQSHFTIGTQPNARTCYLKLCRINKNCENTKKKEGVIRTACTSSCTLTQKALPAIPSNYLTTISLIIWLIASLPEFYVDHYRFDNFIMDDNKVQIFDLYV